MNAGGKAVVKPATLIGRYFAMDRDKNWQRTEKAFLAIAHGVAANRAGDAPTAIEDSYQKNINGRIYRTSCGWRLQRHEGGRCCVVHEFPRRPRAATFDRFG